MLTRGTGIGVGVGEAWGNLENEWVLLRESASAKVLVAQSI